MGEVREEKELQLELTRMRNPYLEEGIGNTSRRQKRTESGSRLRTEQQKTYRSRDIGRGTAACQSGRRRAADTYSRPAGIRVETRVRVQHTEVARERQKRLRQLQRRRKLSVVLIACFASVCLFWWLTSLFLKKGEVQHVNAGGIVSVGDYLPQTESQASSLVEKPDWTEDFLTPNEYSRPGEPLERVDNIFVHYTANVGTSAAQNRSYFEQLKDTHERYASAHFIIGYDGEILQVIPLNEIGCAVQSRNYDSISIECCYLAADGSFTKETYESLINLLAWLLETYNLEPQDILRHYDSGGKKCPLYYTEHEDEWEKLKEEVGEKLGL